jgi:small neutral amino acid transporter SnatA (MarC family)
MRTRQGNAGLLFMHTASLRIRKHWLCGITYLFFIFGQRLVKFIGVNGINVVTRLMGLILAVIGTQMLIQGIHEAKMLF